MDTACAICSNVVVVASTGIGSNFLCNQHYFEWRDWKSFNSDLDLFVKTKRIEAFYDYRKKLTKTLRPG